MPTRYPGDETLKDPLSALARKTEWIDVGEEFYIGSGQRMLTTNSGDFSLLQTRKIVFNEADDSASIAE